MGKQIQLYLVPEDISEFEAVMQQKGVAILRRYSSESKPEVAGTAVFRTPESTGVDGFLVRREDLEVVASRSVPEQAHWVVDALRSPVIEFSGCNFDGKILKRGRLFYDTGFYETSGLWVDKPQVFQDWAKDVFKFARKIFPKDENLGAYVGSNARHWQSTSQGTFVSLSFALRPKAQAS